jgi:hypothetical protein
VQALLDRYPDIDTDAGGESPWSTGPLMDEASGPLVYFPMVWSRCEETSQWAVDLAEESGLNCYDPQWNQLRTQFRESWRFELNPIPLSTAATCNPGAAPPSVQAPAMATTPEVVPI